MKNLPDSKEELSILLRELSTKPGVYKFLGTKMNPLYIGKAKNLRNRVRTYFRESGQNQKILNLIKEAKFLELTLTSTELEALLLEQFLIKEHRPKYNVQFKDDKGYPWIRIEVTNEHPSAKSYLGKKDKKESYFGPYPNSYAVRDALSLIQKTFKLRNCSDSFFKNRTRPCLQHQIERCSAPCVGLISKKEYRKDVKGASMLLEGKSEDLIVDLYKSMDSYSNNQSYEKAAIYRDKISALREIQRSQSIAGFIKDRDALFLHTIEGKVRVGITHVNNGWITGHENYFQETQGLENSVLSEFIKSYYLSDNYCPKFLVLDENISEKLKLEAALSGHHKKQIKIITKPGKKDKGLLEITKSNSISSSIKTLKDSKDISHVFASVKEQLGLKRNLLLIESYDISHHSGAGAVGGCVVYSSRGKLKEKYRLFNISKENSGNDIASMKEVISRRFNNSNLDLEKPSLILIDGGKAHLNAINSVINDMGIKDIELVSISKGIRRKSQMDSIHTLDGRVIRIVKGSISHLFIQEVRDETHRFSISNQKNKILKFSLSSALDDIKGLGPNKKKLLLRYFGSLEQIKRASSLDLLNVLGIGPKLATLIYNHLH